LSKKKKMWICQKKNASSKGRAKTRKEGKRGNVPREGENPWTPTNLCRPAGKREGFAGGRTQKEEKVE